METTQEQLDGMIKDALEKREASNEINLSRISVHAHTGSDTSPVAAESLTFADSTLNNVSSVTHGLAPKSPADATKFLNGAATPDYAQVKDSDLSTTDITTNNVSTSKHGFAPKAPNDATKFLNGANPPAFSVPIGTVTLKTSATASAAQSITISGLDLSTDQQYLIICTYVNGNSSTGGTTELQGVINTDSGANYFYAYQGYTNSGGGGRADAAQSGATGIKFNKDITSIDPNGQIVIWMTAVGANYAFLTWTMGERVPGGGGLIQTTQGMCDYSGSANVTSILIGHTNATSMTSAWSAYVYKYSLT